MANLSNINNKLIVTDGGNLLVNKTAANNAAVGVQLMSTGDVNGTVSGDTVARFNRLGTDGEIIRFQHDTSTDGAINSLSGRIAIGSGTTGIFFDSIRDVLTPHNMTTNAYSSNISLGRSLIRFKDLYLSGKVVAGTGTTDAATINAFSTTVSTGLHSALRIISQPSASNYWDIGATNGASTILNFYHNGTTTPKITFTHTGGATFAGNVGIGTASPTKQLHLLRTTGDVRGIMVETTVATSYAEVQVKAASEFRIGTGGSSTVPNGQFYIYDATAGAHRFDIDANGNVGIGNTNPLAKLQITSGDSGASSPWSNADELVLESSGNAGLAFQTPNTGAATIAFQDPESVQAGFIQYLHADNALRFATNGNNERMRIKSDGNILIADTRQIQFYNTDQYIKATSTNDLEIGAGDDINYRSNFSRFFSGSAEHARLTGVGGTSWVVNGSATHNFGIGTTSPTTKCWVKDSQDSSLFSGLGVERSANTTGVCLNAVGGALNLNTNSSMPLKFRIQNTSMQTINTDGGRAYAGFGGWRMFEYSYTVSVGNGATVDLFQNTSAHSDLHMVQIAIRMFHSGRTYFVGSGVVGGYGMNITGSGSGATNGGLTSAVVSSGIRKLQISQSSGFTAQATIYIQFRLDSGSGINVLNGTLSSL